MTEVRNRKGAESDQVNWENLTIDDEEEDEDEDDVDDENDVDDYIACCIPKVASCSASL